MVKKLIGGHLVFILNLGCIIYEMLTGFPPFYNTSRKDLFDKIKFGQVVYPNKLSFEVKDLLNGLLQKDPKKRFDIGNYLKKIKSNLTLGLKKQIGMLFTTKNQLHHSNHRLQIMKILSISTLNSQNYQYIHQKTMINYKIL